MKKVLFTSLTVLALAAWAVTLGSCSKEGNGGGGITNRPPSSLETDYFTVANATYESGAIPAATTTTPLTDVDANENVLNGGSAPITVVSAFPLDKIYVGVAGITGHFVLEAVPSQTITRAEGDYVYEFTILISQNLGDGFTVVVSGRTESGEVLPEFTHEFGLIHAGTGALQVNMSFSNAKDLDLYVVMPDENIIYYGNEGMSGYDPETYEEYMVWGLDVDSNAGCNIDNINSENIFYPAEYVMNGKYEVYVNMYSNCDPTIATSWVVTALYKGASIGVSYGDNPTGGTFPVGAESTGAGSYDLRYERENGQFEEFVKAMEFTITDGAINPDPDVRTRNLAPRERTPKFSKK